MHLAEFKGRLLVSGGKEHHPLWSSQRLWLPRVNATGLQPDPLENGLRKVPHPLSGHPSNTLRWLLLTQDPTTAAKPSCTRKAPSRSSRGAGRNEVPDDVHCASEDPSSHQREKIMFLLTQSSVCRKGVTEGNTIFSVPGTQYWPGLASITTTVRITESLSQIKNPVTYLPKNREMGRWKEQQIPRL